MALQFGRQLNFDSYLKQELLDPNHKLVRLAGIIDWEEIHDKLSPYYSIVGRQALPIRLMVGLNLLKHMSNCSDEDSVNRLSGDLYWMFFCGVEVADLKGKYSHLDSTSMTKFRNRIGDKGWAVVEGIIRRYLLKTKKMNSKKMATDSSCLEKNVEYPTDSGLLYKGIKKLVKRIRTLEKDGVKKIAHFRTYTRKSKRVVLNMMKLGKDRADRIREGTLELAREAVYIINKSKTMAKRARRQSAAALTITSMENLARLLSRVVVQARERYKGNHIEKKVYSLHEPQVICIKKGKRSKANEYGSKFNISIDKNGYIVSHENYSTNKHDSKLLEPALKNWEEKTGATPKQLNADRGYNQKKKKLKRGRLKKVEKLCIPKNGKTSHPDRKAKWFKEGQSMRAGIEAVIGHLKQDHRLNRSRYSGFRGDKINVTLGCLAWNLNKLARDTS